MRDVEKLLAESGFRWLDPLEQAWYFPKVKEIRGIYLDRPVWLALSIALREHGYDFTNGLGVYAHMDNMRKAYKEQTLSLAR